jgi:hypothetical protein
MEPDKIDAVHTIQSKLEDVQRSQVALVQKLAQLQLDLMNMPDKDLESGLDDLYSNASSNADAIESLLEKYTMKVNVIDQDNSKNGTQEESE